MDATLEALARKARAGDRKALEELARRVQDPIYNLSLRMLWHPQDAEDATQEILVKILTRLGSFQGRSAFMTWAWRVAANHLLTTRRRRMERNRPTFALFGHDLDEGLSETLPEGARGVDAALLEEEVKVGCTHGMLLCLDRGQRLAYALGEIFELPSPQAARVLGISAAAFRQRLARARAALRNFMARKCGLVNPAAACRCRLRVAAAVGRGRVDPCSPLFAGKPAAAMEKARRGVLEIEELHRAAAVFRGHPRYRAPENLLPAVRALLLSGRFQVLG